MYRPSPNQKIVRLSEKVGTISYAIRDMVPLYEAAVRGEKTGYSFNIGDPGLWGFKPLHLITKAEIKAIESEKYTGYAPSTGDPQLREAIASCERLPQERVFVTSGLSEGIMFAVRALLDPGDNFLLPSPGYSLYNSLMRISGCTDNYYCTDKNFQPDIEDMKSKINERTKAIVLINPNNPTGAVYGRKLIEQIVEVAAEARIPIISDEIYSKLVLDGQEFVSVKDVSGDHPVIVGGGTSKNFMYPGARVGYLALHGKGMEELSDAIFKLCNQRLSVNWIAQRGALAAYTAGAEILESFLSPLRKALLERRDAAYEGLSSIPRIRCVKPSAAFYIFPQIDLTGSRFKNDKEFALAAVKEEGVFIVYGADFSPILPGDFFRLVFLAPPGYLEAGIGRLRYFVEHNL